MSRVSWMMDCSHERRRLDILSILQEVNEEKKDLQCEIDKTVNQLEQIEDFFDQCEDIPSFILQTLQITQENLMDYMDKLEDAMPKLESKVAQSTEEYNDEKNEAVEEKCTCVDNFKLL